MDTDNCLAQLQATREALSKSQTELEEARAASLRAGLTIKQFQQIKPSAIKVFLELSARGVGIEIYRSDLCSPTGMGEDTIARALIQLQSMRLITVSKGKLTPYAKHHHAGTLLKIGNV